MNLSIFIWKTGRTQRGHHSYHRSYAEQARLWLPGLAAHAVSNCYRKKERAPILASFWDCLPGDEPLSPLTPGTSQCEACWGPLIKLPSCYLGDVGNAKGLHALTTADAGLKALTWNLQVSIGFLNLQTLFLRCSHSHVSLPECIF